MPWGAVAGGALAAGGSILGGLTSSGASSAASKAQAAAAQQALAFQNMVYGSTVNNVTPWTGIGASALSSLSQAYGLGVPLQANGQPLNTGPNAAIPLLNQLLGAYGTNYQGGSTAAGGGNPLSSMLSAYQQTPFYQFPLQQGTLNSNRQAATLGLNLSPGQAASVNQYGQNYASGFLGNYLSSLGSTLQNYLGGLSNLSTGGQNSALQVGQQGNSSAGNVSNILGSLGNAQASGIVGSANALNSGLGNALSSLTNTNFTNSLSSLFGSGSSFSLANPSGASAPSGLNSAGALGGGIIQ